MAAFDVGDCDAFQPLLLTADIRHKSRVFWPAGAAVGVVNDEDDEDAEAEMEVAKRVREIHWTVVDELTAVGTST